MSFVYLPFGPEFTLVIRDGDGDADGDVDLQMIIYGEVSQCEATLSRRFI